MNLKIFVIVLLLFITSESRRKQGRGDDGNKNKLGMGSIQSKWNDDEEELINNNIGYTPLTQAPLTTTTTSVTTTTTTYPNYNGIRPEYQEVPPAETTPIPVVIPPTTPEPEDPETTEVPRDDKATAPTLEASNKTILWIDATYKAEDKGMNLSTLAECKPWIEYWNENLNLTSTNSTVELSNETLKSTTESEDSSEESEKVEKMEFEVIDSSSRLEEVGLDPELLDEYEAIGVVYKEVCGNHSRQLWYSDPTMARKIGIDEKSTICDPFKEELHPNAETLTNLAIQLNEVIKNFTKNITVTEKSNENVTTLRPENLEYTTKTYDENMMGMFKDSPQYEIQQRVVIRRHRRAGDTVVIEQAEEGTTAEPKPNEESPDQDWLEDIAVEERELLTVAKQKLGDNVSIEEAWIQIDATDETNPLMYILSTDAANALKLKIDPHSFNRYEKVVLHLPGICADYVPTAVDSFNASDFEGIEIEGPIGVNITALELAGVNLTELAEKLRNDTEVDEVLTRTNATRTLGGSYIIPVLQKNQYDAFSAPIVFQGSAVVVRFGIYIESMSNFQTSTMDYDMDIYLIMSWRDARLVNPYGKPILVKEEDILEKIWRPDPFFANAKEAEFHEVTFLNFLMRIFSDGIVLYETRIKLKPACNLVLCKYPHDKQTCELLIKSFAYPVETVRFEWFTNKIDAIDKNPDVKLPELYIDRYEPTVCNKSRKSGEFSCLRALFRLKRDVGFHVAQTYIPTSLALMFSWVGVWLPEEFMEGRIGVAITVLLTLSTESAGAREHLPSVSYMKAIDLWFGYITGFVFFTLLQTLFVIGFDKRANQLRKSANKKRTDLTQEYKDALVHKAERYHKTGRYLDNFCRIFYPLTFLLFLIMYYFVFTEGRQDDCISQR
ncbi:unnamed protein product [Bursaphelenchus xylophilus]|uniref:(pine wood nematode) hypothetical protein n=1 Tax=Bursaphelenchus xylophilus TaxID=6326 RepID=A0A1I7SFE8_BURXY|nr:unnamed protein product [Bursaphelenchus xylophilus]CAG9092754.1 unnamed protein product [Bursaphelenchus xylophilus]